jgi:fatty-acyl-CoA synthase
VGRAFVVCRAGQVVSEADLLEHCRANLAKFKVPRSVVFVEALPKNDTGKINRQALGWT